VTGVARLRALLGRFRGRRLLVVGDVILDEYLTGDATRISPEAPIPVVTVRDDQAMLGAAGYTASHVRHLGGEAVLCGVVGRDAAGDRVRALLRDAGIDGAGLVTDPARPTTIKTRVIARRQQMLRLDRERTDPVPAAVARALLDRVRAVLPRVDGVICSDYDKGAFTPTLIRGLIAAARRARVPVAVNPKPRLALGFRGATVLSLNVGEAAATLRRDLPDLPALLRGGAELRRRLGAMGVLVTRHEHGLVVFEDARSIVIPARAREVFDVTGAGDTIIAVTAMGLAAGGRLEDAVRLANLAAAVEVGKLGCALVSPAEIAAEIRRSAT
jgi:D-beta-D-heptose 7-phosphate kinase/D-beta-D-heptose 1-phosphate adenosyltransferase